jgi:hypothetical protein
MDVPVSGRGRCRTNAERDQGVGKLVGELGGGVDGPTELLHRFDRMVGRHDDDGRLGVLAGDERRPEADARRGVAAHRFADDVVCGNAGKLPDGFVAMGGRRDDPTAFERDLCLDTIERALQQCALAAKREELLRAGGSAPGPEPRPAAAGHDHRVEHNVSFTFQVASFKFTNQEYGTQTGDFGIGNLQLGTWNS